MMLMKNWLIQSGDGGKLIVGLDSHPLDLRVMLHDERTDGYLSLDFGDLVKGFLHPFTTNSQVVMDEAELESLEFAIEHLERHMLLMMSLRDRATVIDDKPDDPAEMPDSARVVPFQRPDGAA